MIFLVVAVLIILLMYKFLLIRSYFFTFSLIAGVCFIIVFFTAVHYVGYTQKMGLLLGVAAVFIGFAMITLMLSWRDIEKSDRLIFAKDFFLYGFSMFLIIACIFSIILLPVAAFLRPFSDGCKENVEAIIRRERVEEKRRQKEEEEEYVRRKVWKEEGRTDVQFNSDSTRWKYSDEEWNDSRRV